MYFLECASEKEDHLQSVHDNYLFLLNGCRWRIAFSTSLNLFIFFPSIEVAILTLDDNETWHGILLLKVTIMEGILRK